MNMKNIINEYKELKETVNKYLDIYLTPDTIKEPKIIFHQIE